MKSNEIRWFYGLLVMWAVPAMAAEATMDAVVETSAGATAHLATLWKRPTVLFYEDKDSAGLNQHVKDALFERGRDQGLLDAVSVVAVANVAAFDWFPARNFVLAAVRDVERQWNLPARSSTVVVLNAAGEVIWKVKGRLSPVEVRALFSVLEGQLQPH